MHPDKFEKALLKNATPDFKKFESLPMSVFISSSEGVIVRANQKANNLFSINPNVNRTSIKEFYLDKNERGIVIKKLNNTKHGDWQYNQTLEFLIENRKISVRYFAKPYFNKAGLYLGCLCLMFEITEFERFREIEELIPSCIFEINSFGRISYNNKKFRDQFNYVDSEEIIAESIFYYKDDYHNILHELREKESILNREVKFIRKNKSPFIGNLNIFRELFEEDNIIRCKASIEDITFDSILSDVPIGLYYVISEGQSDKILSANRAFAEIIGLKDSSECEGINMKDLHVDINSYTDFRKKLIEANHNKSILKNYMIQIKTVDNDIKDIIVNVKSIEEQRSNERVVIGRVGAIYDVTNDIQRKFSQWEKDFASFLHSYSAQSVTIRDSLQAIMSEQCGELEAENKNLINDTANKLANAITGLKSSLSTFFKIGLEKRVLNQTTIDSVMNRIDKCGEMKNRGIKTASAFYREQTLLIKDTIYREVKTDLLSRETMRIVTSEIDQILKLTRILTLTSVANELDEMLLDTDMLKEALSLGLNEKTNSNKDNYSVNVVDIIRSIIRSLDSLTKTRKIVIQMNNSIDSITYMANERLLYGALYNVIHNAVKYSWVKAEDKASWVDIRLYQNAKEILIEIENRGVPITKIELENDLIFNFGYRGRKSSDRARPGSGIGLWYTKKIVQQYGGEIKVTSVPMNFNANDDFSKAFITTVKIKLKKTNYENN